MAKVNKENSAAEAAAELNNIEVVVSEETLLVRFIKSPTRTFNLAYSKGDEVEFPIAFAAELIELGFAEAVGTEL